MEAPAAKDILNVNLPKWPALVVRGEPVTQRQAGEIIIRTDRFEFLCNDRRWNHQLNEAAGIKMQDDWFPEFGSLFEARKKYRVLDIHYLANDQIASSFIGGPHGWCSWDGYIGSNDYNIGKWPSAEVVLEEWQKIAAAFPYLSLRAQLFSGEGCEEQIEPVVEYVVQEGEAMAVEPTGRLDATREISEASLISLIHLPPALRERGCTIEQFRWGLELAERGA